MTRVDDKRYERATSRVEISTPLLAAVTLARASDL
jgi:hypothetical protein